MSRTTPQAWSDDAAMNVAGFDVVKRNVTAGDGLVDTIIKVKVKDQSRYVEMGMKHFGLLLERLHLTTDAEVMKILDAGRQHAHEQSLRGGGLVRDQHGADVPSGHAGGVVLLVADLPGREL